MGLNSIVYRLRNAPHTDNGRPQIHLISQEVISFVVGKLSASHLVVHYGIVVPSLPPTCRVKWTKYRSYSGGVLKESKIGRDWKSGRPGFEGDADPLIISLMRQKTTIWIYQIRYQSPSFGGLAVQVLTLNLNRTNLLPSGDIT